MNLDRDDTSSYGPETVTVYRLNESGIYSYYVYDYTNGGDDFSDEMGTKSKAKVKVYDEGALVTTFSVPYGEEGDCWHVFDYNAATKEVIPVNTMGYVDYSSAVGRETSSGELNDQNMSAAVDAKLEAADLQIINQDMKEKEN